MSSGFPYPALIVDPQGVSTSVKITDRNSNTASAYTDAYGLNSVSFPDTITDRKTYFLPGEGPWTVTPTVDGVAKSGITLTLGRSQEIGTVLVPIVFARSTQVGGGGSGTPATTVTGPDAFGAAAVVGTGTDYARSDHDHGLPANPVPAFAAPSAVGQANTTGAASTINHSDHVHQGVTSLTAGSTKVAVTGGDGSGHGAVTVDLGSSVAVVQENVNTVAASSTAQTIPDVTTDTINQITLTGNCVFTFPTAAAGKSFSVALTQDATGSRTASWPATVKWPGGTAPTLTTTAAKTDTLSFVCYDGTHWLGYVTGMNF